MVLAVAVVEVVAVVVVEVEAGAATLARERLTHHMTPHARPALRGLRGDFCIGRCVWAQAVHLVKFAHSFFHPRFLQQR